MKERLYLNKEVSAITGLSQRQVISWTEKGLVKPARPAIKAGTMRGYDYKNLLEFGLVKYLTDIIGVQFFTAKTILDDLRDDGEIELWASNYSAYRTSFADKVTDKDDELLASLHEVARHNDPYGRGGTFESLSPEIPKPLKEDGTLYYIFTGEGLEKGYKSTIRIISPWTVAETIEALQIGEDFENIKNSCGMIVVNLGRIKKEIDNGIKSLS